MELTADLRYDSRAPEHADLTRDEYESQLLVLHDAITADAIKAGGVVVTLPVVSAADGTEWTDYRDLVTGTAVSDGCPLILTASGHVVRVLTD